MYFSPNIWLFCLKDGIQWFLGIHKQQQIESHDTEKLSNYQRAVRSLLQKQAVRVIVAMTTLVKKVHVFETMMKLVIQLDK